MPKGIKNPRQIKDKTIILQMSHSIQQLRMGTLCVDPSDCAYLQRAGDCRSPASHPGTGFSVQDLDAATPLC